MKRSNTQFERQADIDRRIRAEEFPSVPNLASDLPLGTLLNHFYEQVLGLVYRLK